MEHVSEIEGLHFICPLHGMNNTTAPRYLKETKTAYKSITSHHITSITRLNSSSKSNKNAKNSAAVKTKKKIKTNKTDSIQNRTANVTTAQRSEWFSGRSSDSRTPWRPAPLPCRPRRPRPSDTPAERADAQALCCSCTPCGCHSGMGA